MNFPEATIQKLKEHYEARVLLNKRPTLYDCAVDIGLKRTPHNKPAGEAERLCNYLTGSGRVIYIPGPLGLVATFPIRSHKPSLPLLANNLKQPPGRDIPGAALPAGASRHATE